MTGRALATLTAAALLSLAGCGVPVPSFPAPAGVEPTPRAVAEREPGMVQATDAASVLETLTIRPPIEVPGYSRAKFRHWTAGPDGCDGRERAIARAAGALSGCPASIVSVPDFYSGRQVLVSSADGDHVWPLHAAWDAGASDWTPAEREAFANDPLAVAMTASSVNESKSDRMPPRWATPNPTLECGYVARLVAIGQKYRLDVTTTERNAMRAALRGCPGQALRGGGR